LSQRRSLTCAWLSAYAFFVGLVIVSSAHTAQNAVGSSPKGTAGPGFVECRGFVYPNKRFVLKLRPEERLTEIMVSKGERVKAGQAVARIENTALLTTFLDLTGRRNDYQSLRDESEVLTLDLNLHQAASERLTAKIDKVRNLKETLPDYPIEKEMEPLIDKKFEIEDQIKLITARLAHLQARLRAQQASTGLIERKIEAARMRLEEDVVKAPFPGMVVERALDPDRLSPEGVICELWDDSAFLIEVEILQHQLAYVHPGEPAIVALDFSRGESAEAAIDSIEPGSMVPEPSGHPKFKAILKLNKTVPWLRPGMQVAVRVRSEGAK